MNNIEIKENFETACEAYVRAFCQRHEIGFEGWVRGRVGEVAGIGDYFFGMDEIRYDVDTEQPEEKIFEWVDYMNQLSSLGCTKRINYEHFCKGAPLPYSREDLMKIEEAQRKAAEAQRFLKECIANAKSSY